MPWRALLSLWGIFHIPRVMLQLAMRQRWLLSLILCFAIKVFMLLILLLLLLLLTMRIIICIAVQLRNSNQESCSNIPDSVSTCLFLFKLLYSFFSKCMSVSSEYVACPTRSDVISFYSSGDLGMYICSCHREGCALQTSIPLTRAALGNRRLEWISPPSVYLLLTFGFPWNFCLNWLKNNVEAKCCIHIHIRDETEKTCTWVSP